MFRLFGSRKYILWTNIKSYECTYPDTVSLNAEYFNHANQQMVKSSTDFHIIIIISQKLHIKLKKEMSIYFLD